MGIDFFTLRPLNVLADRSHDFCSGFAVVRLAPAAIFRTTENTKPLTAGLLGGYDVLSICGYSTRAYSEAQLRAIVAFVRRGGTLILASCSGIFELTTGLDVERLTHNAIAGLFGFRFLSAADLPADDDAVHGFDREQVELTASGAQSGLEMGDLPLIRPARLAVPPGATILLRDKQGRRPIMAVARIGQGRVLVCNDLGMWNSNVSFVAAYWVAMFAPQRRVKSTGRPPTLLQEPYRKELHREGITLYAGPATRRQASRLLELAVPIRDEILRIVRPAKRPTEWRIYAQTGCGYWNINQSERVIESHVGCTFSDAAIVSELTRSLAEQLVPARLHWSWRLFWQPTVDYLRVRLLRKLGFDAYAEQIAGSWLPEEAADLGRVYTEVRKPRPLRRFWLDAEAEFGADVLAKCLRAVPCKEAPTQFDSRRLSDLDVIAYLLALDHGPRVYQWLASQGNTVRPLPRVAMDSRKLKPAMKRWVANRLLDMKTPTSERFDAAANLSARLKEDKTPFDRCVRQAASRQVAEALAAAFYLAQAKDERGRDALKRWLGCKDAGVAAIAALALVFEYHDRDGADALVRLAPSQDVRFQISVGYALKLAKDPRAKRFAFRKLPGCSVKIVRDGIVKAFPTVDGYEVANVWAGPMVRPVQYANGYSVYYVYWVHTSPQWRRRGMARTGMNACLKSRWDKSCAMTSLHTGTGNVAHALYRDYGLVDYFRGVRFEKTLRPESIVRPPKGIDIRRLTPGQQPQVMELLITEAARRPADRPYHQVYSDHRPTYIALRRGQPIGLAIAQPRGESATLEQFVLSPLKDKDGKSDDKAREQTGLALLSAVHREMLSRKLKAISTTLWQPTSDTSAIWMLRRSGYGSSLSGMVELYRINSLAQYLSQIASVFEQRLKDAGTFATWRGTVAIESPTQKATLAIDAGKVRILPATRNGQSPSISIRGDEVAIQRLVTGITSCFEEYLQIHVDAAPLVNDSLQELLEALFPRLMPEG